MTYQPEFSGRSGSRSGGRTCGVGYAMDCYQRYDYESILYIFNHLGDTIDVILDIWGTKRKEKTTKEEICKRAKKKRKRKKKKDDIEVSNMQTIRKGSMRWGGRW